MDFFDAVDHLRGIHTELRFSVGSEFEGLTEQFPELWQSSTIRSPAGKILAFQVGEADEWELAYGYQNPDGQLDFADDDNGELITPNFITNVRVYTRWALRDPGASD